MDVVGAILIFLFLVALFGPEPKSRRQRDMESAFPKDRWTIYPSLENEGKWGIYRGGIMYVEYDTKKEAEDKVASLY